MLQFGIKDQVSNTEHGWANQVELIQLHEIGKKPQFLLLKFLENMKKLTKW
jgi:hypothetical protein